MTTINQRKRTMKLKIALILSLLSCPALAQTYDTFRPYYTPPAYTPPVYTPPTTYQSQGNRLYGSDGTVVQSYGNRDYITRPNGSTTTCSTYGSITTCQ